MLGRVWPRHGHRGRPLNLVVSWHSASMSSAPKTYGDIDAFVTMLLAACDDAGMNDTLESLLSQPEQNRKDIVQYLLQQFRERQAPQSLIEAFAPLLDDAVAERAYEVIFQCKRQ